MNLAVTLDRFIRAMRDCQSREHFEQIVVLVYERSFAAGRQGIRATRAEIIGHAASRPSLRAVIVGAIEEALAPVAQILGDAQARGWMRPDVDPRAFAYWNLANITALVVVELCEDQTLIEHFRRLMLDAISVLMKDWPEAVERD